MIGETRDLRVQWALEETGLPYRVHGFDHTGGELDGPAYSRISCFHLVPVAEAAHLRTVAVVPPDNSFKATPLRGATKFGLWATRW